MNLSDSAQYPSELLNRVGNEMKGMSAELSDAASQLKLLEGEDDIHGHRVDAAVQQFHEKWQKYRDDQQQSINNLGEVSISISQETVALDIQLFNLIDSVDVPNFPGMGIE